MVSGGRLQLKGETHCPYLCNAIKLAWSVQNAEQRIYHAVSPEYCLYGCLGGNPWDIKKKKAKKKKALKADEVEEGDILENGDVRTKGATIPFLQPHCCWHRFRVPDGTNKAN